MGFAKAAGFKIKKLWGVQGAGLVNLLEVNPGLYLAEAVVDPEMVVDILEGIPGVEVKDPSLVLPPGVRGGAWIVEGPSAKPHGVQGDLGTDHPSSSEEA